MSDDSRNIIPCGSGTSKPIRHYLQKAGKFVLALLLLVNSNLKAQTATISGTTTVCQNGPQPVITFTGSGGTAPYIFTYVINGGTPQTTPSGNPSVFVPAPTDIAGIFTYNLISVTDATLTTVLQIGTAIVTVNPLPTPIAGSNSPQCSGSTLNLTSSGGTSYSLSLIHI